VCFSPLHVLNGLAGAVSTTKHTKDTKGGEKKQALRSFVAEHGITFVADYWTGHSCFFIFLRGFALRDELLPLSRGECEGHEGKAVGMRTLSKPFELTAMRAPRERE